MTLREIPCLTASALKRSSHASNEPLSRQSAASAATPTNITAATTGAAHRYLRLIRFMGTPLWWESLGILTTGVAGSWPILSLPGFGEGRGGIRERSEQGR